MRSLVFYRNAPGHPFSGAITHAERTRHVGPYDWAPAYIEVDDWRPNWDSTHFVLDGQLAPIPPRVVLSIRNSTAMVRLRVRRAALLEDFDRIRSNPTRWDALPAETRESWLAYRQALLDWPALERRPRTPTEPQPPKD